MGVGVMKDYKLKLRNLHVSHTLGWSWNFSPDNSDDLLVPSLFVSDRISCCL
jgi:hypothetical protein